MDAKQVFGTLPEGWVERLRIEYCPRCGGSCEEAVEGGVPRGKCTQCSYVHFINPAPCVAVVVVSNEKVLLCKRGAGTRFEGLWCLPSGYIEYGEDFITAGLREVQEETGLNVEVQGIVSVVSNFWSHDASTLVVVLLAVLLGGEPRPDGVETSEVSWFTAEALPEGMAFSADAHIIQRYFVAREPGARVDPQFTRIEGGDAVYTPPPALYAL